MERDGDEIEVKCLLFFDYFCVTFLLSSFYFSQFMQLLCIILFDED